MQCGFVFPFVIAERFFQMPNYLGGLLEHSLKLRLIYLDYILSQTILCFPQSLLHFPDMVARITFSYTKKMSRSLLNIAKRSLPILMLSGVSLASKNTV